MCCVLRAGGGIRCSPVTGDQTCALPILSCLAWPCLALPCLASPRLASSCLVLPCLASPRLAWPCLALPCLASPRVASPCLASRYFGSCPPCAPSTQAAGSKAQRSKYARDQVARPRALAPCARPLPFLGWRGAPGVSQLVLCAMFSDYRPFCVVVRLPHSRCIQRRSRPQNRERPNSYCSPPEWWKLWFSVTP